MNITHLRRGGIPKTCYITYLSPASKVSAFLMRALSSASPIASLQSNSGSGRSECEEGSHGHFDVSASVNEYSK